MGQLTEKIYKIREGILRDMPSNTLLTYKEAKSAIEENPSQEIKDIISNSPMAMIHPGKKHAHLESVIGWSSSRNCFYCYNLGRIAMYPIQDGNFSIETVARLYENLIELGEYKSLND